MEPNDSGCAVTRFLIHHQRIFHQQRLVEPTLQKRENFTCKNIYYVLKVCTVYYLKPDSSLVENRKNDVEKDHYYHAFVTSFNNSSPQS